MDQFQNNRNSTVQLLNVFDDVNFIFDLDDYLMITWICNVQIQRQLVLKNSKR